MIERVDDIVRAEATVISLGSITAAIIIIITMTAMVERDGTPETANMKIVTGINDIIVIMKTMKKRSKGRLSGIVRISRADCPEMRNTSSGTHGWKDPR